MKNISPGAKLGVIFGIIAAGLPPFSPAGAVPEPAAREAMNLRLDDRGPYLILATSSASKSYGKAIANAKELHPAAAYDTFAADDFEGALKLLKAHQPRYALLFIEPQELDVNFAWQWLTLTTQVNADPFVDVRTGFITGATPDDAAAFMQRIAAAVAGRVKLPGLFMDNLGPNSQAAKSAFQSFPGNLMIPVIDKRLACLAISHGAEGFSDERLTSMQGAGLVHLGGHGSPDRVDDGVRGSQASRLALSPCIVFNGACYTGVTQRWYDQVTADGKVAQKTVAAVDCFCLNLLRNRAVAYLAALHPDHGMPVYQEMEFLAFTGAPLGDVIKYTHDGVILGAGGHLPRFEHLAGGMPVPQWTGEQVMLKGTAARVLFGDPSLVVLDRFTDAPFKVVDKQDGNTVHVTATLANSLLKSTYTDTYHDDLARVRNLFNDRALIVVDLPHGWDSVSGIEVVGVTAAGQPMRHRLVGYGVEQDGESRRLHVQVDIASEGFMQSPFRVANAAVELNVRR
jgi:hypothetical protein